MAFLSWHCQPLSLRGTVKIRIRDQTGWIDRNGEPFGFPHPDFTCHDPKGSIACQILLQQVSNLTTVDAEVWPRRVPLLIFVAVILLLSRLPQPAKCSYNNTFGSLLSIISLFSPVKHLNRTQRDSPTYSPVGTEKKTIQNTFLTHADYKLRLSKT